MWYTIQNVDDVLACILMLCLAELATVWVLIFGDINL